MQQATKYKANVAPIAHNETEASAREHAGFDLGGSSGLINLKTK